MEMQIHPLSSLFEQLGLASSQQEIQYFINKNKPVPGTVELDQADFWSAAQASFLREAKQQDADWAEIVDRLDAMLRS